LTNLCRSRCWAEKRVLENSAGRRESPAVCFRVRAVARDGLHHPTHGPLRIHACAQCLPDPSQSPKVAELMAVSRARRGTWVPPPPLALCSTSLAARTPCNTQHAPRNVQVTQVATCTLRPAEPARQGLRAHIEPRQARRTVHACMRTHTGAMLTEHTPLAQSHEGTGMRHKGRSLGTQCSDMPPAHARTSARECICIHVDIHNGTATYHLRGSKRGQTYLLPPSARAALTVLVLLLVPSALREHMPYACTRLRVGHSCVPRGKRGGEILPGGRGARP
jgi:hypothetical protein